MTSSSSDENFFLKSLKQTSDLLGEWGFNSLQKVFWDNQITYYCLKHIKSKDLDDLCKLSNATVGAKILLRRHIEKHFNVSIREDSEVLSCLQQTDLEHITQNPKSVKEILNIGPRGAILLQKKKLNDSLKSLVVANIVDYYLDYNFPWNKSVWEKITAEIVNIFPKESASTYYKPSCTFDGRYHKAAGKLIDRYNNERTRRKKLNDEGDEAEENSALSEELNSSRSQLPAELSEEEQTKSMKWLETSRTPKKLVYEHWKNSFITRQNFLKVNSKIKSILLAWPILGTPICPALVNIDFERHYGDKTQLFKMWPDFVDKFQLLVKQIKDSNSKKFAKNLKNNLTVDGRDIVICYLLPSLILSTFKKDLSKDKNKKDIWRPAILESRQAFIVHAQNSIQMEVEIQKRKKTVKDKGLNFQPMLIVLGGEEIFEGQYFYTCCEGFVQKFNHFIEALDFTFKLTRILRLKYAEDCSQIWTFFEVFFYKIPSKNDCRCATVTNFIDSIND